MAGPADKHINRKRKQTRRKGKEKEKERGEGKEEKIEKKAMAALLVFIMATL